MSYAQTALAESPLKVSSSVKDGDPAILTEIYQAERNIAIWQRSLPTLMSQQIDDLLQQRERLSLVQSVSPQDCATWLLSMLDDHPVSAALSKDVALIVDMFCCLFDVKEAGLRLTALDEAMRPKFHFDRVPCRLVATYAGTATQWLDNHQLDRSKLGAGSLGLPDHLSGLYESEDAIQHLSAGDVALLKGSGWEGNEETGLVHRSPALKSGERRLLLTLDLI